MANENFDEKILLTDEEGLETAFEHVLTFLYERERYVALTPWNDEDTDDEAEIVLLRLVSENGEDRYVSIDNEILLHEVFDEFITLVEEMQEGMDEEQE